MFKLMRVFNNKTEIVKYIVQLVTIMISIQRNSVFLIIFATVLYLNNELLSNEYFSTLPMFYNRTFSTYAKLVFMRCIITLAVLFIPVLIFFPNNGLNIFVLINLICLLFVLTLGYARPKVKFSESASTALLQNGIWYLTEIAYLIIVEYLVKAQSLNQIALNTILNIGVAAPLMIMVIIFLRRKYLKNKRENTKMYMKRGSYVNS